LRPHAGPKPVRTTPPRYGKMEAEKLAEPTREPDFFDWYQSLIRPFPIEQSARSGVFQMSAE